MVTWSASADRLNDAALLAAIALGDSAAATVFVRRHQRAVYGLALTMCGDARSSEDIAQLTFERVWRHAANFDERRGSARTWTLTIARRLSIDLLRSRRPVVTDGQRLLDDRPDAGPGVEDRAVDRADLQRLRHLVDDLPPDQRTALLLATLGGHTAAEIAEICDIPLGTAKTRIRQALLRVRAGAERAEARHG